MKVRTLKITPILEDIQIGHQHEPRAQTGYSKVLLTLFLQLKKDHNLKLSRVLELWSNLFIFWVLSPFMAMFLDHNV